MTKLIGSKLEKDIRERIAKANRTFSADKRNLPMIEYILYKFSVDHFYILKEIPDQAIDVLQFLVGQQVVSVDRVRENSDFVISKIEDRKKYMTGKEKSMLILFEILDKDESVDNGIGAIQLSD